MSYLTNKVPDEEHSVMLKDEDLEFIARRKAQLARPRRRAIARFTQLDLPLLLMPVFNSILMTERAS